MRTKLLALSLATAIPLGISCTVDTEGDDGPDDRAAEIVDNLLSAGFTMDDIAVRQDGRVFLNGDAEVTVFAARELAEAAGDFRQYRTWELVNTVAVTDICIDDTDVQTQTQSDALDAAIAHYNGPGADVHLSFTMRRVGADHTDCNAVITFVSEAGTVGGSAGFPSGGMPYHTINIGEGLEPYGVAVTAHVITHELGHCIGFRHSDYYNRSISCGGNGPAWRFDEGVAGIGADHIPGTPEDAVRNGSVMNACFHSGSTGDWSDSDLTALDVLYGDAEDCTNALDDDGDGNTDCDDRLCIATDPACQPAPPPAENCTNGVDDDGDGAADCADSDCASDAACAPPPGECLPAGATCGSGSECCSGSCPRGGRNANTCR